MCNKKDKKILTDDLELHIIEIPKAKDIQEATGLSINEIEKL